MFNDIAVAHREIYALYEIAQTMGTSLGVPDTMALVASRLANLVPFSTCALFLYSEESRDTLLPLRDRGRLRDHPAARAQDRTRLDGLGRPQSPSARERAAKC